MKTKTKILGLVLAAVLLVSASIYGTMAYLTSTDKVENTFTVGKVALTLDEAEVDADGKAITGADRVKENEYHLLPGKEYDKDPTVHVAADSEAAWLFVKVENGLVAIEGGTTIAAQIATNGWELLEEGGNIYYQQYTKDAVDGDFVVFENFTISGNVKGGSSSDTGAVEGDLYLGDYAGATIVVTAYAVQADGFENAADAWDATFGA